MTHDSVGDYWSALLNECHHELGWKQLEHTPLIGEVVWCAYCHAERTVKSLVGAWRVRCKDCRYARKFGRARLLAERKAAKHARDHPGHNVTWWQSGNEANARVCSLSTQGQSMIPYRREGDPPW